VVALGAVILTDEAHVEESASESMGGARAHAEMLGQLRHPGVVVMLEVLEQVDRPGDRLGT